MCEVYEQDGMKVLIVRKCISVRVYEQDGMKVLVPGVGDFGGMGSCMTSNLSHTFMCFIELQHP